MINNDPPINQQVISVSSSQSSDDTVIYSTPPEEFEEQEERNPQRILDIEEYRMNRSPRGFCVILNMEQFLNLSNRPGSSQDRDNVQKTFTDLSFIVKIHNDLTADGMVKTLTEYSQEDHSQYDCFVCVILSHGNKDHILGSDGKPVPIKSLTDPFKSSACQGLSGKPKLFFIQAGQGNVKQKGQKIQSDSVPVMEDMVEVEVIPDEHDFLLAMSTISGFESFRCEITGSFFIQKLCEVIQQFKESHHILDILTIVNREVGKMDADIEGSKYKQSPAPIFTLQKQLYLRSN